ncbi:MAG: hypothetical protein GF308_12935 [Candidatus Heimdallarchaeota archaeon]|nr:hypothetical protein [Candidatus Heimdallarchaeota archaeon]
MSKWIVVYDSRSGNTKKIAKKIAEGLNSELSNIHQEPLYSSYEAIVFGAWIKANELSCREKLLQLPRSDLQAKTAAMFLTCTFPNKTINDTGDLVVDKVFKDFRTILSEKGMDVCDQPFLSKGAAKLFHWGFGFKAIGHPTKNELLQAKDFGFSLRKKFE